MKFLLHWINIKLRDYLELANEIILSDPDDDLIKERDLN